MSPSERSDADDRDLPGARIDWSLAAGVGRRLTRPGPRTTTYTLTTARDELATLAARAEGPVRETTGLADGLPVPAASVLDRPEWIDAAARSMSAMLGGGASASPGMAGRVGGVQAGGLLALLSGAILGQYDPFTPDPATGTDGVLMLVTPNIIAVERSLKVVPSDFRYWVCLHEVTHRVQFSATPWLRDYMLENIATISTENDESGAELAARVVGVLRSDKPREKGVLGAMQLLQTPEQYESFTRLMMLGTLLEGHADHVMDAVGPSHVPTVDRIRSAFDERRQRKQSPMQRVLRALIGMDAKLAQYIRGKAFVDEVVGTVGMARFNAVWSGPETLPRPAEIDSPRLWVDRVL
ncbi:zinc-dependent metalloprotease [uncultured Williamsia sp.]|uniref:zinc-dependent metalloprotease n=1 Tax=uncultured Williamsia sp. TaxID=259311 RepID=UPI002620DEC6|nr:zinc-dependent metalloprotease [uncultured Williamsia sp.]